ncbi:P2X purinoceptor 4 [Galemys pyrenaicus]|uniref:P2X purinoceptor 4 n=1 Tax=Galemys pyrenaicus TaxID=202257 RepID=A0A8J6A3W8_GALPY|nr:P2X purinoceptor 4 [Galemys pyrenaicus]
MGRGPLGVGPTWGGDCLGQGQGFRRCTAPSGRPAGAGPEAGPEAGPRAGRGRAPGYQAAGRGDRSGRSSEHRGGHWAPGVRTGFARTRRQADAAMARCCAVLTAFLFEYDTPRIVLIRSRKVGLMNRAVQLLILAYVVGWVFVWEKGYQETDSVVSSVTTKAKGVAVTNTSNLGFRIWDVADYVIPAQEENSLFIMTNMIVTTNQTQGLCPEVPEKTTMCDSDANCTTGSTSTHSNGVQTGRCVQFNKTLKTCEVAAWCPVENDLEVPRRNILPNITTTYLKSCTYDAGTDPFCPIFRLGQIVESAGHSFQDVAVEGGIMGIQIHWACNLDRAAALCLPRYSFRRLDTRDLSHNVSPGYNFRWEPGVSGAAGPDNLLPAERMQHLPPAPPASASLPRGCRHTAQAGGVQGGDPPSVHGPGGGGPAAVHLRCAARFAKYYKDLSGTEHRTLTKAYGIRFDIVVFGKAGKFDIIPTMINVGSGVALLGVATVLCDVVVLYCMKKKYYYREKKYKYVEDYEQVGPAARQDGAAPAEERLFLRDSRRDGQGPNTAPLAGVQASPSSAAFLKARLGPVPFLLRWPLGPPGSALASSWPGLQGTQEASRIPSGAREAGQGPTEACSRLKLPSEPTGRGHSALRNHPHWPGQGSQARRAADPPPTVRLPGPWGGSKKLRLDRPRARLSGFLQPHTHCQLQEMHLNRPDSRC